MDGYRAVDRSLGKFVLPGLGLSVVGTLWAGAWFHGFQSIILVFGHKEAAQIFRYSMSRPGFTWTYSFIPLNLILARTDYADFALPGSSLLLLSTQITDKFDIDYTMWPPLPSTVFACLPAIRSVYNWGYHKAFCELNKKWLAEVQPSHVQRGDGQVDNGAQTDDDDLQEGDMVLEIEVNDHGRVENEGEGDGADGQAGNANAGQGQPENQHVQRILRHELVDSGGSIGQTILGALVFPAVAASMGNLISYALPTSWLSYRSSTSGRPGLLSTKWGRSVVGGCLFVVLKDALLLYCRWRLATTHRQRRIMNFDKQTKKYSV